MHSQNRFARFLAGASLVALSALFFSSTWLTSWSASENIVNAVEAGVPDTVSAQTWLQIVLGFIGLTVVLSSLANIINLTFLTMFTGLEKLFVFALPISTVSLTPLLGAPTPLLPVIVIIVSVTLRSEKPGKWPSSATKQDA
jgi:hypothetical protein